MDECGVAVDRDLLLPLSTRAGLVDKPIRPRRSNSNSSNLTTSPSSREIEHFTPNKDWSGPPRCGRQVCLNARGEILNVDPFDLRRGRAVLLIDDVRTGRVERDGFRRVVAIERMPTAARLSVRRQTNTRLPAGSVNVGNLLARVLATD